MTPCHLSEFEPRLRTEFNSQTTLFDQIDKGILLDIASFKKELHL